MYYFMYCLFLYLFGFCEFYVSKDDRYMKLKHCLMSGKEKQPTFSSKVDSNIPQRTDYTKTLGLIISFWTHAASVK